MSTCFQYSSDAFHISFQRVRRLKELQHSASKSQKYDLWSPKVFFLGNSAGSAGLEQITERCDWMNLTNSSIHLKFCKVISSPWNRWITDDFCALRLRELLFIRLLFCSLVHQSQFLYVSGCRAVPLAFYRGYSLFLSWLLCSILIAVTT